MRELEQDWARLPDREKNRLDVPGISVRNILGLTQHMVSGNLEAAARCAGVSADGVGALELASGSRYSVRLARDKLLIVSASEGLLEYGWHNDGYAVSGMSSALEIFELSGPLSLEIVKRATVLSHTGPSPCAATGFAGVSAYVYRFDDHQKVRVHLDRGLAPYLWDWLRAVLSGQNFTVESGRLRNLGHIPSTTAEPDHSGQ